MMVEPAGRGRNPFDSQEVLRGADGIARYAGRPGSLVQMLQATVERDRDATALVEVGGPSLTYGQLWDGAARVAGGLRGAGVERGDRAAILLPNGADWVLAFWGIQLAGGVVVPVNTRFKEAEVAYVLEDSGAAFAFAPEAELPSVLCVDPKPPPPPRLPWLVLPKPHAPAPPVWVVEPA